MTSGLFGLKVLLKRLHRQIMDLCEHVDVCYLLQYAAATMTLVEFQLTSDTINPYCCKLSRFYNVYDNLVSFLKNCFYSPSPKSNINLWSTWIERKIFVKFFVHEWSYFSDESVKFFYGLLRKLLLILLLLDIGFLLWLLVFSIILSLCVSLCRFWFFLLV